MKPKSYSALVFDLDGTLADTIGAALDIYNQMAKDYGYRIIPKEDLPNIRHFSLKEFINYAGVPALNVPQLLLKGRNQLKKQIHTLPLITGIDLLIPTVRPLVPKLGILTSNSTENAELFLNAHQLLPYFDFISSSSKLTSKAKNLRAICKTFSIPPHEMLYIGDEIRDIKAAKKASVDALAVTWGFNSHQALQNELPNYLCQTPDELLTTLRAIT